MDVIATDLTEEWTVNTVTYDWNSMTARERDALVAEKVMGYPNSPNLYQEMYWFYGGRYKCKKDEFTPSVDIADAWPIIEKFRLSHGHASVEGTYAPNLRLDKYFCYIGHQSEYNEDDSIFAVSTSAPEAICIAALRACGVEVTA